jgi:serine/threonine protein kinase
MFLPKYYLNIDKKSPYYKKLFLDYLPGDTLDTFLAFNKHTVSIYTKIYFFIQILQALRFVGNHGIVHLDVKENNIIVLKNMVCKLIDFGESYHYKVCG